MEEGSKYGNESYLPRVIQLFPITFNPQPAQFSSLCHPIPIIWEKAATLLTLRTILCLGSGCSPVLEEMHLLDITTCVETQALNKTLGKLILKVQISPWARMRSISLYSSLFCPLLIGIMISKFWFFHLLLECPQQGPLPLCSSHFTSGRRKMKLSSESQDKLNGIVYIKCNFQKYVGFPTYVLHFYINKIQKYVFET